MTKQKKPKTGDVVGWAIIDAFGTVFGGYTSRRKASEYAAIRAGGRVVKLVLVK